MAVAHERMAGAVRALSMDAVEAAASGHVGLPLGFADVATRLWSGVLKHDPADPHWPDRDRFVLSAGHGSMLAYSLLHLSGYASVSMDDIRAFRQLGSATPGHPENFVTTGIETTTGPLGQGLATAVGMAMAEAHLSALFGSELVDHRIWVAAGDGCLMEGVSQEAITLAGHQKLHKLVVLFDDNAVTIDGGTDLSDATDQVARFAASGWATRRIDGHDTQEIDDALRWAQQQDRPAFIACRTRIGFGAPTLEGTGKAHGGPYGADEVAGVRSAIGWTDAPFTLPEDVRAAWREAGAARAGEHAAWRERVAASPEGDALLERLGGKLPEGFDAAALAARKTAEGRKAEATRKSSGAALEHFTAALPAMIGGSADLSGSNNTRASGMEAFTPDDRTGRYVHYGVREHAMAAAMNGMALHGGVIPYSGTFLVFSDYSRAAIRLGALMGERVVHVMTHDSIGLGEDGPTHQPVEHLAALRAMPNCHVFRPSDALETAECWELALRRTEGPSVLALSRQGVPPLRGQGAHPGAGEANLSAPGAYLLRDPEDAAVTLLATGSEVHLAAQAADRLAEEGIAARLVSMPCLDLFAAQPEAVRSAVLGSLPRLAVEAGVRFGWDRWIGEGGAFVGMEGFGASAPAADLFEHFGITANAVAEAARRLAKAG